METFSNWNQVVLDSISAMGQKIMANLPAVIGAIFLVLIGWLLGKFVAMLISKLLHAAKFDNLTQRLEIDAVLEKAEVKMKPSQLVGKFAYWAVLLIFLTTASDTLGWAGVSKSINDLLLYLPRLFSAIIVFVLGFYIAIITKKGLNSLFISTSVPAGAGISIFAYYIILVITSLTALSQAGVDTTVITANLSIILGGVVVAFALSFGLGSKEVLSNIVAGYYLRGTLRKGQKVQVAGFSGEVESIEKTTVTIKNETERIIIPTRKFTDEAVVVKL